MRGGLGLGLGLGCTWCRVEVRVRLGLGLGCTWYRVEAVREYLEAHLESEDQGEAHVEGEEHLAEGAAVLQSGFP